MLMWCSSQSRARHNNQYVAVAVLLIETVLPTKCCCHSHGEILKCCSEHQNLNYSRKKILSSCFQASSKWKTITMRFCLIFVHLQGLNNLSEDVISRYYTYIIYICIHIFISLPFTLEFSSFTHHCAWLFCFVQITARNVYGEKIIVQEYKCSGES